MDIYGYSSLLMSQTHQTLSERISFKLLIHKTTQVIALLLINDLTVVNYDKNNDLFVFHMNINSLQYHFDELQTFLSNCLIDFQILGISESR